MNSDRKRAIVQPDKLFATEPYAATLIDRPSRYTPALTFKSDLVAFHPDGHPDWYAGLGGTPDEALADALDYFWRAVQQHGASRAENFVWAGSPEW